MTRESVDGRIARRAALRHGVFSRDDAIGLGATPRMMQRRLATDRWEQLHPGVYRVAGAPRSWRQDLLAACLAAGNGAVASHRASAGLFSMAGVEHRPAEIIVPRGRRVRRAGIIAHQIGPIHEADLTSVNAIPTTTPTRTLIDLGAVVPREVVEEALDDALRRGLTSLPRLRWRIAELERRGRSGIAVVRALVEARAQGGGIPQSVFETRVLRLLERGGLPLPERQYPIRVRGHLAAIVDFAYPDVRLAIEADGYRWHSGRVRWERDLERRNSLTSLGWRVIHVTPSDLDVRPEGVLRMVADALTGGSAASQKSGKT